MNDRISPHTPFMKASQPDSFDFLSETEVSRRAGAYEQNRRAYFKKEGWYLANYALDLLLEKTAGKFRNDGVTPEWIHSARPTELLDSMTRSGLLNRQEIEAKYGSYEIAICAQLLHDLGENEQITPTYLRNYLYSRINTEHDGGYSHLEHIHDGKNIEKIVRDFELLTYVKNDETGFDDYLHRMMESGYAFFCKLGDRADNLATLIGVKRPHWPSMTDSKQDLQSTQQYFESIGRYYRHTSDVFSTNDIIGQACREHPAFAKAYDAMDAVLGFLFRMNRAYYGYHPNNTHNRPGSSKRMSGFNLQVDVSQYIEKAYKAYEHTHHGVNPVEIIMSRIKAESSEFPVLNFKMQTEARDRGLSPPSTLTQVSNMFKGLGSRFTTFGL